MVDLCPDAFCLQGSNNKSNHTQHSKKGISLTFLVMLSYSKVIITARTVMISRIVVSVVVMRTVIGSFF